MEFINLDVLIYLRKSRKDQEEERRAMEEGRSYDVLERHRRTLMELARKQNHNVIGIYQEVVSGEFISERPQMQELLRKVQSGAVDAVLCMDLDRFGRGDMIDQGTIQRAFKESETLIITPDRIYDFNNEMDEEFSEFQFMFARKELKIITKRLQRGRRASAKEGHNITNRVPFGYQRGNDLILRPDPAKAPLVRMIYEMSAEGYGMRTIAERLNRMGIPSPTGGDWDRSSLTYIIQNEVYQGHIIWGKKRYRKTQDGYQRKPLPESEWIVHRNAHEAIISDNLAERARKAIDKRYKPPIKTNTELRNPLAGLIYCAQCGSAMALLQRYGGRRDSLICPTPGCGQRSAVFELVEKAVVASLRDILESLEVDIDDAELDNKEDKMDLFINTIEALEKELAELNKQKDSLHDLLERGIYDVDTYLDRSQKITERIKDTEKRLSQTKELAEAERSNINSPSKDLPQIKKTIELYETAQNAKEKNRLMKAILDKVIFNRTVNARKMDEFDLQIYLKVR
jgi:DNA invertase Pin-like site-specific DNA recombinase